MTRAEIEHALRPFEDLERVLLRNYRFEEVPEIEGAQSNGAATSTLEAAVADGLPMSIADRWLGLGSGRCVLVFGEDLAVKVPWNLAGAVDNLAEVACWLSDERVREAMMSPVGLTPSLLLITERAQRLWPEPQSTLDDRPAACERWLDPINALRERIGLAPDTVASVRLENYGVRGDGELVALDVTGGSPAALAYAFKRRRRAVFWLDDHARQDYAREAPRLEARHEKSGWGRGPTAPLTLRGIAAAAGWTPGAGWGSWPCGACDSGAGELECCGAGWPIEDLVYR